MNIDRKKQIEDMVDASVNINEEYGMEKALGYIIGEKFFNYIKRLKQIGIGLDQIEKEKEKPDYNPIRKIKVIDTETEINLDEDYDMYDKEMPIMNGLIEYFAELIMENFSMDEIEGYIRNVKRLGTFGHVVDEETHRLFIEKGAVEYSLDTEVDDILVLGEIHKYFGLEI